jgi:alkylation response protein AidB-like acyl-CoA dehydrogenase
MNTAPAEATAPFTLPPQHLQVQAEARELAARFAARHREVRLSGIEKGELHPELWSEISSRGWPGLLIPVEHGGSAGGLLAYAVVLEELAAANLLLWPPVLDSAIAHAILQVGPDVARAEWLEKVASGECHFGLAVTEPECGHNVFRSKVTIGRDGDGYRVNGVKAITSATDMVDRVLVFGRVPRGEREEGPAQFTTVFVDPRGDGVTTTEIPMRGREGVRQFQLDFREAHAPGSALVGEEGQGLLALWPSTHIERVLMAALAIGNARYCITRALHRAGDRGVFGDRPIGAEQSIQHPIAHLHARLQAVQLFVHRTAAHFDAGIDSFQIAGEANMTKVLSAQLVFDAADHAVQTLGAQAWDEREGIIDLYLDARCSRSAPISQELALNFVAQHVLGLPTHR